MREGRLGPCCPHLCLQNIPASPADGWPEVDLAQPPALSTVLPIRWLLLLSPGPRECEPEKPESLGTGGLGLVGAPRLRAVAAVLRVGAMGHLVSSFRGRAVGP